MYVLSGFVCGCVFYMGVLVCIGECFLPRLFVKYVFTSA